MHRTVIGILIGLMLAAPIRNGEVAAAEMLTPLERVANTPKGQLKNPYLDFTSIAEEGHRKYMAAGAMVVTAGAEAEAWPHPRPILFGYMVMTTTRYSG